MCEAGYAPWNKVDPYPLATAECFNLGPDGICTHEMSPHSGQACPDKGYPEGPAYGAGIWWAPLNQD